MGSTIGYPDKSSIPHDPEACKFCAEMLEDEKKRIEISRIKSKVDDKQQ